MKYAGRGFCVSGGGDSTILFGGIVWGQKLYVTEVKGFLAAAYLQNILWKKTGEIEVTDPGGEAGEVTTPY